MSFPFHNNSANLAAIAHHWQEIRNQQNQVAIQAQQIVHGRNVALLSSPGFEREGELLLQAEILVTGDKTKEGQLIQAVAVPWFEIITEWKRDPEFIFRLKPRQLEELVAGAYQKAGCDEVILTPASGDRGRDVIVTVTYPGIGVVRIVDQVKRYAKGHRVDADEVRALLGVLARDSNVSKGIVTTTSEFAPGITGELAAFIPTRLELKNGSQLQEWLLGLTGQG